MDEWEYKIERQQEMYEETKRFEDREYCIEYYEDILIDAKKQIDLFLISIERYDHDISLKEALSIIEEA